MKRLLLVLLLAGCHDDRGHAMTTDELRDHNIEVMHAAQQSALYGCPIGGKTTATTNAHGYITRMGIRCQ